MNQEQKKFLFKRHETGYHRQAVNVLARWVKGRKEQIFMVGNYPLFIPDIACYKNGILTSIYEVIYSHALTGHKLGLIQYWCYLNSKAISVFEISADYILSQIEKPEILETMEYYDIDPFQNKDIRSLIEVESVISY